MIVDAGMASERPCGRPAIARCSGEPICEKCIADRVAEDDPECHPMTPLMGALERDRAVIARMGTFERDMAILAHAALVDTLAARDAEIVRLQAEAGNYQRATSQWQVSFADKCKEVVAVEKERDAAIDQLRKNRDLAATIIAVKDQEIERLKTKAVVGWGQQLVDEAIASMPDVVGDVEFSPEMLAAMSSDDDAAPLHPGVTYVADCLRTEYTPNFVRMGWGNPKAVEGMEIEQVNRHDRMISRLLHAVLGLMSEVGEIADQLKKHIIYGKPLDLVNLVEENGDENWYQSLLLDAIGSSWEESWHKNIQKLKQRYPEKFTQAQALHRDLDAERAILAASNFKVDPAPRAWRSSYENDVPLHVDRPVMHQLPRHLDEPPLKFLFVVNGEVAEVESVRREYGAVLRPSILGAIQLALEHTNNTTRPSDEWELRDQYGALIPDVLRGDLLTTLKPDEHYYLTLKLGAGGSKCPPHPPEFMDMDYKGEPGKHFRCGLCGATFAGMGG